MTPPPIRILLLDDQADTLFCYVLLLQAAGHYVVGAQSAAEARRICADETFDLLVSDIRLTDADGADVFRELRSRCGMRGIALSGLSATSDVQRSLDAGFAIHLSKPIDIEQLEEAIATTMAVAV